MKAPALSRPEAPRMAKCDRLDIGIQGDAVGIGWTERRHLGRREKVP